MEEEEEEEDMDVDVDVDICDDLRFDLDMVFGRLWTYEYGCSFCIPRYSTRTLTTLMIDNVTPCLRMTPYRFSYLYEQSGANALELTS